MGITPAYHLSHQVAHSFKAALPAVLQGLLQQVLGGNEDVVVTAGRKAPAANDAFFQLEVSFLPACHCSVQPQHSSSSGRSVQARKRMPEAAIDTVLKCPRFENRVLSGAKTPHLLAAKDGQTCNPDMIESSATRCAVYVPTMLPTTCSESNVHGCRTSMCSSCCKDAKSSSGDTCNAAPPKNCHCAVHLS